MTSPTEGDVWRYPYLWARQNAAGETEGRKARPCVIAVALASQADATRIFLLAVTSQPPGANTAAIPVPDTEKRRAGLSVDIPLWVIIDECNVDVVERSFYLEPTAKTGAVSDRFLRQVKAALLDRLKSREVGVVGRR